MGERIPQSAAIRVPLKAYLTSDHVTPATGKTIAITISKNGAAFGNPSAGATNATEISNGWYYVDLSTTDTGTVGPLVVLGTVAAVDPVDIAYDVAAFQAFPANFSSLAITGEGAVTAGTGDAFARLGAPAGASIAADVASVKTDTGTTIPGKFPTNSAALVISAAGNVNADIKKVNAVTVNGDGSATPWGP